MLSATARTNIRAVHNFLALRAVPTGKPRAPQQMRAGVKVSTGLLFSTAVSTVLARARRPLRSFSTSSPRPFQKRPMKPVYRDSSMCRKTLTAEIQSGTSNVSTSDPSPLPYSLSAPQPARKTQRICPMEQSNLAKFAASSPVRLLAHFPEKKDVHTHDRGGGRDAPLNAIGRAASLRACGAACRGRCGVLTVMWDGRRRAARFHGRRLEDADEAGAGWRFRISSSGKQARRSVPQRPVQASFRIHFRNARTPGLRLESAVVMRQHRAGASTCRSNRGTSAPRSISRAITRECPIAAPMLSTAASTTML